MVKTNQPETFTVCLHCAGEFAPGETQCPEDGNKLDVMTAEQHEVWLRYLEAPTFEEECNGPRIPGWNEL